MVDDSRGSGGTLCLSSVAFLVAVFARVVQVVMVLCSTILLVGNVCVGICSYGNVRTFPC